MFKLATTLFLALGSAEASLRSRRLSFEAIVGYEPGSLVTDHNALDLDQAALEKQLALGTSESFGIAENIYRNGAHSKSVATVTLSAGLTGPITAKTEVSGRNAAGNQVTGVVYESYSSGTTQVRIQYDTIYIQSSYMECRVGSNPEPVTEGCLAPTGELVIGGQTFPYTYDVLSDNRNERTLQGFSTDAEEKMYRCDNCPYTTYDKFYQYYGEFDYADKWIMAAFDGRSTTFANGNADFGQYSEVGRREAIKKGTAFMSVWMYVIREMEDAIDDCKSECDPDVNCNDDPVHAWDEAVAFYAGSLEGKDGSGSGVMLHALADKRCINFKTCGDLANELSGTSHVNQQILAEFIDGKRKLRSGQCAAVKDNKNRIESLMTIPLVQGTLRYAYITDFEESTEKAEAEGAVFAASVLPVVNACDEDAADTIYDSMRTGQNGRADFIAVKRAFESVYSCMNIRCEDVGGLHDVATGGYLPQAAPCGLKKKKDEKKTGLIVGLSLGAVAAIIIAFFVGRKCCGSHSNIQATDDLQSGEKIVA